ncbi:MAG: protein kinase, partial [Chitinophagaceae bacterium]|nr:protein kinase [Chitinophagaceae bacterium]
MDVKKELDVLEVFPGYDILEKIHESYPHSAFLARKKEDGSQVIIKTLSDQYPRKENLAGIQREYRIMRDLGLNGVIRVYDLIPHGHGNLAMVMERFGISLNRYLSTFNNRVPPLDLFLDIAIKTVDICRQMHEKKIVHKNLHPSNILIDPGTGDLR